MPKYLSGRTRRIPQSQLTDDRFEYLNISQAEPNIGDPTVPGPEIPVGQQYQLISVLGFPGDRYWIPVGGGLIPGTISVYDEGILTPPGGVSSITQLDFVGAGVSAEGYIDEFGYPGVGVTITVFSPGTQGQVIFNNQNDFRGAPRLFYDNQENYVGIGTSLPTQDLHVDGNIRLTGTIYDSDNQPGLEAQVIVKNGVGGVNWTNTTAVVTAAGGTIGQVQFHSNTGLVDGADIFYYDDLNDRVGIGSTQPTELLDVLGISKFTGTTYIDNLNVENLDSQDLNVSVLGTFAELIVTGDTTLQNTLNADVGAYIDDVTIGINDTNVISTSSGELVLDSNTQTVSIPNTASIGFLTSRDAYIGVLTAANLDFLNSNVIYLNVTGIATINNAEINDLTVVDSAEIKNLEVTDYFDVSGNANFQKQVDINNLNVSGISTTDNIEISGSNINSKSGNLVLSSQTGNIVTQELVRINSTQDSSDKDSGSVVIDGGVGIEKNTNIGGDLNVSGETKLSINGGITTTGGDLYVGGDIFINDDLFLDDINANTGTFTQLVTTKDLVVTDNSTLLSLNVTGFSTFAKLIDANDGAIINNVAIAVFDDNEINTFTGDLKLNSSGGTVNVNDNLKVTGTSNFDGNVNLGNSTSDVVNFTSRINSNILPSTNNTRDLGSSTLKWNEIYATTFVGQFIGNADTATRLETVSRSVNATHYLTFVDSNNGSAAYEYYYTDGSITYNPSTNILTAANLTVTSNAIFNGNVDLGNSGTDTVTFNARVDSNILPSTNNTRDLGSSTLKWNEIYATTFIGQFIGNADTATRLETVTRSVNATHYLTFVDSNNGSAAYEYYYTDDGISYNPSLNLLNVGNLTVSVNAIFNGNVDLGNEVSDTVTFAGRVDSNILPSTDNTVDLGSNVLRWNEIYATTFIGSFTGNADTATRLETVSRSVNATHYLTFVDSNNGSAAYEYYYTDGSITYNPSTNILTAANLTVTSNAIFNGNVDLGNSGTDTVTFTGRVDSNILPSTNNTRDLGSSSLKWNEVYATNFIGEFSGNADTATRLETVTRSVDATHYLTFVDSNNGSAAYEYYYTDGDLYYNPSTNLLNVRDLTVRGNCTLGNNASVDIVTFVSRVNSNIIPSNSNTYNLGATNFKWNQIHANEFIGEFTGNADTASKLETVATNTNADHFLTFVDSNNTSGVDYESYYTDAGIKYNPSTNRLTSVNLAVSGKSDLNGNVDLGSNTGNSITFEGRVDSNILPSTNNTRDLGSNTLKWNEVYATTFVGQFIGNADTATYAERAGLADNIERDGSNQILYQSSNDNTELLTSGNSGQLLQSNGSTSPPSWVTPGALEVESADNLTGGSPGNIPYQQSSGNTKFIPNGTSGQVLISNGSGQPSWGEAYDITFPAGTRMLFQQTNAPTGWVKVTNQNNKALRVVSGTAGSGGSVDFTSAFKSNIPITGSIDGGTVNAHTLTLSQIPSHDHTGNVFGSGNHNHGGFAGGGGHNHNGGTSSGGGHGHNGYTTSQGGHNHAYYSPAGGAQTQGGSGQGGMWQGQQVRNTIAGGNHNHNVFVGGGGHNHNIATFGGGNHSHNFNLFGGGHNHGLNLNPRGGGGSHSHGFTAPSFSGGNINLAVRYIDVIIAQKS